MVWCTTRIAYFRTIAASQRFVIAISGCRRGCESSPTAAVELPIQEAAVEKGEVVRTTFREIDYPDLPHGDGGGATYWDGGNHELETKRGNGSDGRSARARAVEKLRLAPEPLTSSSGVKTRVEEGGMIAYIRACLLPFEILQDKRVRTVLFGYILFSVRRALFAVDYNLYTVHRRSAVRWQVALLYLVDALWFCARCYGAAIFGLYLL